MWCLERWELQVSVNLPRSTPPPPPIFRKAQSSCHRCSLVGAVWICRSGEQLSQWQRLRKWTTRIEDTREPEAASPAAHPWPFHWRLSRRWVSAWAARSRVVLLHRTCPHRREVRSADTKFGKRGKVREEQLLEKKGKVIMMQRLRTFLLKVFAFWRFLIQGLTNLRQVCFKFAKGFRKWVCRKPHGVQN